MTSENAPKPGVMTMDREAWAKQLNLCNFINAYYQYRDLQSLSGVRRVLLVGPGQGLDTAVLRWRGYEVTTFDIDATFSPDIVGSVHDLNMFADHSFDAVIVSHVLEHLPPAFLDASLAELARVSRFALVYLPQTGRTLELTIAPGIRGWRWSALLGYFNWFSRPDPSRPRFCGGEHYWEVGRMGWSHRAIAKRMSRHFRVLKRYRNRDWTFSYNFVLESL